MKKKKENSMAIQLTFFDEPTEERILELEMKKLAASQDKLRKALFARHGELAKKYVEMHNRLEILERNICKGS